MKKTELRRLIRQKKRALTPEQIETASDRLAERLFRHPLYRQARTVYLYLSCNQEVRTAPILRRALADGKRVAAPCVEGERLRFRLLTADTPLVPDAFGAPEPLGSPPVDDPTALVLLPGLAFGAGARDAFIPKIIRPLSGRTRGRPARRRARPARGAACRSNHRRRRGCAARADRFPARA